MLLASPVAELSRRRLRSPCGNTRTPNTFVICFRSRMSESLDHITGLILFQKAIAKPRTRTCKPRIPSQVLNSNNLTYLHSFVCFVPKPISQFRRISLLQCFPTVIYVPSLSPGDKCNPSFLRDRQTPALTHARLKAGTFVMSTRPARCRFRPSVFLRKWTAQQKSTGVSVSELKL